MRRILALSILIGACGGGGSAPPQRSYMAPDPYGEPEPELAPEREPGPEPVPVSDPEPVPAKGGGGGSEADTFLALHNEFRAKHCAPALKWSNDLAKVAQKWADKLKKDGCVFGHSRTKYGENLAAGTSGALSAETIVTMWYREVDKYNFKKPGFAMDTGHFTQLVWVSTARIGCGRTECKGMDIVVCNYDPPGNVATMFPREVLPTSCKRGKK